MRASQAVLVGELACQYAGVIRDTGSIPGLGRSPWRRNGNPLQSYYLENPIERESSRATDHRVAKSQTQLK